MGKRSRKRGAPGAPRPSTAVDTAHPRPAAAAARRGRPVDRKARREEAPQALWHPVPVTETLIFIGLVLVLIGFFTNAIAMLAIGMVIVSVAALELAIREHFAGYKSHSALLAAVCAVVVNVPLYWTPLPQPGLLVTGALAFAAAFQLLRNAFAKQAGGLKFRA
ncbi:hypothetical protein [Paraconexibacter sp.]|uniref:hypothetical protein n=1 Tax=Paraconexibacter sp. TaxID=2949640 RepID=UPI003563744C